MKDGCNLHDSQLKKYKVRGKNINMAFFFNHEKICWSNIEIGVESLEFLHNDRHTREYWHAFKPYKNSILFLISFYFGVKLCVGISCTS